MKHLAEVEFCCDIVPLSRSPFFEQMNFDHLNPCKNGYDNANPEAITKVPQEKDQLDLDCFSSRIPVTIKACDINF